LMKIRDGVFYLGTLGRPEVLSTYLVGEGGDFALIEPGPSNTVEELLGLLGREGVPASSIKYMVATHVHLDHAGGAWKLSRHLPEAKVVVYRGAGKHLTDPEKLVKGAEAVLGPLYGLWGGMEPLDEGKLLEVTDGEALKVGGRTLRFIYAPGHSPYHMAVQEERSKCLFTGDAVGMYVAERDTLWPASPLPTFRYDESMETIRQLQTFSPSVLLIPHYGPHADVRRLFQLNVSIYESWYKVIGSQPPDAAISHVVSELFRCIPSYSWIPSDELASWIITMHATGFRKYCLESRSA
jgi:glyoxylase-like metal-dependent hydrolase (beta-lactamase superfamily II)